MKQTYPENWPKFYTATIQGWKHLLKTEKYKAVIIDSLKFLVDSNRVKVSAFVIMDNHVHFIWQAMYGYNLKDIQTSFKKYTANQFAKLLTEDKNIEQYAVNAIDRKYHFWKRNSLGIELFSETVFIQKLNYIHMNPVKAGVCKYAEEYEYSSALFYLKELNNFGFLKHYKD
jgi:putative transposase